MHLTHERFARFRLNKINKRGNDKNVLKHRIKHVVNVYAGLCGLYCYCNNAHQQNEGSESMNIYIYTTTTTLVNRPFSRTTRVNRYRNAFILDTIGAKDELRMMEMVVTTGTIRRAKRQSNRHHQQTNIIYSVSQKGTRIVE